MENSSGSESIIDESSGQQTELLNPVQRQLMEYRLKHRQNSEKLLKQSEEE